MKTKKDSEEEEEEEEEGEHMNYDERKAKVLDLHKYEPRPTETGGSAGSRKEGRVFQQQMRELLNVKGRVN